MSKEQVLKMCQLVGESLRLGHYRIEVEFVDEIEGYPDAWAVVNIAKAGNRANIRIINELLEEDAKTISAIIVHEFLHIHLIRISESVVELLDGLSKDKADAIQNMVNIEIERATDALSLAIADLIDWGEIGDSEPVA